MPRKRLDLAVEPDIAQVAVGLPARIAQRLDVTLGLPAEHAAQVGHDGIDDVAVVEGDLAGNHAGDRNELDLAVRPFLDEPPVGLRRKRPRRHDGVHGHFGAAERPDDRLRLERLLAEELLQRPVGDGFQVASRPPLTMRQIESRLAWLTKLTPIRPMA